MKVVILLVASLLLTILGALLNNGCLGGVAGWTFIILAVVAPIKYYNTRKRVEAQRQYQYYMQQQYQQQ